MADPQIKFDDGAGYERQMGTWSRFAGEVFLDWLKPPPDLAWIDVGCGNGAFTELVVDRCAPASIDGVDPSEGQLAFARQRPAGRVAKFHQGDAMALPFPGKQFDIATMALVIFFVPDPPKGVAEIVRVLRPGGIAAAYAWDMLGGGFPLEPVQAEMRALGITPVAPPSPGASRIDALQQLWSAAGLTEVTTRDITVQRTFSDFDDFWTTALLGASMKATIAKLASSDVEIIKARVRSKLLPDAAGRITCSARANAIKGRVAA
jgi:ubiquinone/menaquinone biosynthesis C-methylase UbiE